MSWRLDEEKDSEDSESLDRGFSAFSDLFANLSFVFIFLYVVSSFQGALTIKHAKQKLEKATADSAAFGNPTTPMSKEEYAMIIDRLSKLKAMTQDERDKYKKLAAEQAEKEKSLSEYQHALEAMLADNIAAQKKLEQARQGQQKLSLQKSAIQKQLVETEAQHQAETKKLSETLAQTESKVTHLTQEKKRALASLKEVTETSAQQATIRKSIAEQLSKSLKSVGAKAKIDEHSADLFIQFGEAYFDYGSSSLKDGMQDTLKKVIPLYAKTIFSDPEVVKNVESIEIVGLASPTFRGKYVDPSSLDKAAQPALKHNLDLSYRRARSIFDYVFNTSKMDYSHQKELLAITKVSGVGYLQAKKSDRKPSSDGKKEEFCDLNDCTGYQRVLIRVNLKNKSQQGAKKNVQSNR